MIKKKLEKTGPIEIDLTGPDGNVFVLMGKVSGLLRMQGRENEKDRIISEMTSSDYENAVRVFDEEFGEIVILYR
jgi:hypothetical protein